jgi:peptidoglycan/xylan/chitin deacetylase (PgdA/CDA1 family)
MEPRKYGPFPYIPINRRPKITWPNGARVAVWVAPNFEAFALDEKMPVGKGKIPDVMYWSLRDYGARVGVFRVMDVLSQRNIRASVMLNSDVCDVYPEMIEDAMKLNWEFLGHNETNTRPLNDIPPDDEKRVVHDSLTKIEKATGKRPRGWLGSGVQETWNTLDYLADEGLDYVCDWVNDDQPYMIDAGDGKQMVSLPYSMEINDRSAFDRYYRSSDEFELMIRRQFDTLYREGVESGRVMSISVHPFIIGVPHRIWALESGLDYIAGHDDVWFATGVEIVDHYIKSGVTF